MMCYKDKTFCQYWQGCKDSGPCERKLTAQIRMEAEQADMPICMFADFPNCFVKREYTK